MQQNSTETSSKLSRSQENATQQPSTNRAQFPGVAYNPRFAITPESMGMNLRSVISAPKRDQKLRDELPLVDVKSYNERHNNKSLVKELADCRHESNESFRSPQSNTPTNSCASMADNKTELMTQSLSPNVSPKTALQQWNFENHLNNECTQLGAKFPSDYNFMENLKSTGEQFETSDQFCYEQQLQKFRSGSDTHMVNSVKLNFNLLNDVYAKRLESIDENAWGDKDLKICTYQEWVELLTNINKSIINNTAELEKEVEDRLNLAQKRVNSNCRHSQGNELMKCRKDIDTLLKYIRNVRNCGDWDLQDFTFETIKPFEVLGEYDYLTTGVTDGDEIKNFNDPDNVQKNKLFANMKALAHEVAEKHDEVRELKRQVICLEDEIQKAQKKIQLKDDVIKELRNDLKCANNKLSSQQSLDSSSAMPPVNFGNQTSRSSNTQMTDNTPPFQIDNSSQFDSLSLTEMEERQTFKLLNEELSGFFEINENVNKQKTEEQRKRLMEVIQKIESEKDAAYRKLYFIRCQLIDLESNSAGSNYDCDSGFHSKSENDQDGKILDGIRKRLYKLNEMNCELKKKIQKLELDKSELSNNLQSEKSFSGRSSEILRQIADLLCLMKGKQFSYNEVYDSSSNFFCEAIIEMQNDFQERESQLLNDLGKVNKQREELSQLLLNNEKHFSEVGAIHSNRNMFKDIDNNTTTLLSTSSQPLSITACTSTEPPPRALLPTLLSTSLTGQQSENTTVTSLHKDL